MANGLTPRESEEVLIITHKSIVVWWKQILINLIILVSGLVLFFLDLNGYIFILSMILLIVGVIFGLVTFSVWYYNLYIITNMRMVIMVKKQLLHRETYEVDARDIVNSRSIHKGFWSYVFRFGTVSVDVRNGEPVNLTFVYDADYVSQTIHTLGSTTNR